MIPSDPQGAAVEGLFLLRGGKATLFAERLGLARDARWRTARVIGVSLLVSWVPLLALAAIENVAWGNRVAIPLLADFLPYGRYFLAVPLLIAAEGAVGARLSLALAELRRSQFLDTEAASTLDAAVGRAVDLWRGPYVMAALLVAVYGVILSSLWTGTGAAGGTWEQPGPEANPYTSLAGWWHLLISAPLLRFLTYRWLWQWLLWGRLLWRIARLPIRVAPMHPDGAGGLGFLGSAQTGFAAVVLAVSLQVGCVIAGAVRYGGVQLADYRGHAVLFTILALAFVFAPLLPLVSRLARAKWEAEAPLSGWASRAERLLRKSLYEGDTATSLAGPEISGLSDFGALLGQARWMRLVPVDNRNVATVLAAALLPVVPLLFLAMPARDVLQKILNILT